MIREQAARPSRRRPRELLLGIGDDCALLRPRAREDLVVTTDFSLEGRHFRRDWHPPASIGHRILARGLSDLAAMGARPVAAFLSLAVPRSLAGNAPWLRLMLDGFFALARRTGTPLAGGDTSEAPDNNLLADILLLGAVPRGAALRRDGASPGDRLFVTGSLGGAAFQLHELLARPPGRPRRPGQGLAPHFFPEPRLAVGQMLRRRGLATAALDLSDGLSTDLHHLCRASGVVAEVNAAELPLSPLLRGSPRAEALELALHGGEDYELLFAAPPGKRVTPALDGVALTEIGRLLRPARGRPTVTLQEQDGRAVPLLPGGWEHLR